LRGGGNVGETSVGVFVADLQCPVVVGECESLRIGGEFGGISACVDELERVDFAGFEFVECRFGGSGDLAVLAGGVSQDELAALHLGGLDAPALRVAGAGIADDDAESEAKLPVRWCGVCHLHGAYSVGGRSASGARLFIRSNSKFRSFGLGLR